jgi:hypothetical protein
MGAEELLLAAAAELKKQEQQRHEQLLHYYPAAAAALGVRSSSEQDQQQQRAAPGNVDTVAAAAMRLSGRQGGADARGASGAAAGGMQPCSLSLELERQLEQLPPLMPADMHAPHLHQQLPGHPSRVSGGTTNPAAGSMLPPPLQLPTNAAAAAAAQAAATAATNYLDRHEVPAGSRQAALEAVSAAAVTAASRAQLPVPGTPGLEGLDSLFFESHLISNTSRGLPLCTLQPAAAVAASSPSPFGAMLPFSGHYQLYGGSGGSSAGRLSPAWQQQHQHQRLGIGSPQLPPLPSATAVKQQQPDGILSSQEDPSLLIPFHDQPSGSFDAAWLGGGGGSTSASEAAASAMAAIRSAARAAAAADRETGGFLLDGEPTSGTAGFAVGVKRPAGGLGPCGAVPVAGGGAAAGSGGSSCPPILRLPGFPVDEDDEALVGSDTASAEQQAALEAAAAAARVQHEVSMARRLPAQQAVKEEPSATTPTAAQAAAAAAAEATQLAEMAAAAAVARSMQQQQQQQQQQEGPAPMLAGARGAAEAAAGRNVWLSGPGSSTNPSQLPLMIPVPQSPSPPITAAGTGAASRYSSGTAGSTFSHPSEGTAVAAAALAGMAGLESTNQTTSSAQQQQPGWQPASEQQQQAVGQAGPAVGVLRVLAMPGSGADISLSPRLLPDWSQLSQQPGSWHQPLALRPLSPLRLAGPLDISGGGAAGPAPAAISGSGRRPPLPPDAPTCTASAAAAAAAAASAGQPNESVVLPAGSGTLARLPADAWLTPPSN